jgi:hypothetical protein
MPTVHEILHAHHEGFATGAILFALVTVLLFALILFYGFTLPTVEPGAFLNNPNLAP